MRDKRSRAISSYFKVIPLHFVESILLFLLFCKKVKIDHFVYTEKIFALIPFPRDI